MQPVIIRERLHHFIDSLPAGSLSEVYFLIDEKYPKKYKTVFLDEDDKISDEEADLLVQQLLG